MCFSVYALYVLWLLEGHLFLLHYVHTFPQNVNDPDSAGTFLPTDPKVVSQKKQGKMLFMFVLTYYVCVIRACGLLLPPPEKLLS